MLLPFTKMHGCGNDYIFLDCRAREFALTAAKIAALSDRHTGIGSDGVVMILPSETAAAKMRMFNADGSEGAMCGNALRCVAKYLYDHSTPDSRPLSLIIDTASGPKSVTLHINKAGEAHSATIDMGPATISPQIPLESYLPPIPLESCLPLLITPVSLGNPHAVLFLPALAALDLPALAAAVAPHFPSGVNLECAKVLSKASIVARVHERGSGETLACGTGACAVANAAVSLGLSPKNAPISIEMPGGTLCVTVTDATTYLTAPCETAFSGTAEI